MKSVHVKSLDSDILNVVRNDGKGIKFNPEHDRVSMVYYIVWDFNLSGCSKEPTI